VRRGQKLVILSLVVVVAGAWFLVNPGDGFGISQFGITTYRRVPLPYTDLQVRADGSLRVVTKSHQVDRERLAWLLTPQAPEFLVIATGWRSGVHPEGSLSPAGTTVIALPTPAALTKYNALRKQGLRVAIHVHSTC
jgi:hypothetical protein